MTTKSNVGLYILEIATTVAILAVLAVVLGALCAQGFTASTAVAGVVVAAVTAMALPELRSAFCALRAEQRNRVRVVRGARVLAYQGELYELKRSLGQA